MAEKLRMTDERVSNQFVQKIHNVAFQILCDVDDYCKKNHITYYLSGGSCLGAVRHHGFIPWDHDVDIMLPRKDYEKFLVGFAKASKGKYKVGSLLTEKKWVRQYSKIWDIHTKLVEITFDEMERGISIDVFPIDGLPAGKTARKIFYFKTKLFFKYRRLMVRNTFYEDEKFLVLKKLLKKIGGRQASRRSAIKLDMLARKYDFDSSKYVGVSMACHYWDKETIEHKYMDHPVYMLFEGRKFPVVNGYDRYLTNLYGDYMKVPKGEEDYQKNFMTTWNVEFSDSDTDKLKRNEDKE